MLMSLILSVLILWMSFFLSVFEIMLMIIVMVLLFLIQITVMDSSVMAYQFNMDLLNSLLIILTMWIVLLMIKASFSNKVSLSKNFMFYVNLMMVLLIICFLVSNLLAFYFFFESVLFPIIMMIFGWGNQPERLQAGYYMLMYTIMGSFPLFVMIIKYLNNSFSLNYIYMDWLYYSLNNFFIFIMLGFVVKIPMFLFHLWLPKAHVEAPISGSMILAGVLLKLGIYGIFRFKMMILNKLIFYSNFFISVSMWGGVMISIFCLYQTDIKSLIAYSSISHMSVVFSGMLSFSMFGSLGALLLMVGHGLCSSGLFCLANLFYERVYSRSMVMLKGLKSIFPSLSFWWFLFSIVNMSAPLTMNLFGEFFLSLSILKISIFFFLPIMLMIFLSACYSIFMYSHINHGQGWSLGPTNLINLREFNLLLLHLLPLFFWFLKTSFFCQGI
uniref:NADH-ubiquinone oxidoreductase chain 4 n=1 Tax=Amblyomma geoemydae TaxID=1325863 RepID=A0A5P8FTA6_9ACAR|nr:NADH dehydrogenase subunit 4 [Amblyomma geoemydae]